jgi:hypothetical protein
MRRFGLSVVGLTLALTLPGTTQAAALPDLVISNVVVSGSAAVVLIRNQGDAPAGACTLSLLVKQKSNGMFLGTWSAPVPALLPGRTISVTVSAGSSTFPISLQKNRVLWFYVDSLNVVLEANENNNTFLKIMP